MARRRPAVLGYLYAVLLLAVGVVGYLSNGYRPEPTVITSVFPSVLVAASGGTGSGVAGTGAGTALLESSPGPATVGLYQTIDLVARVPAARLGDSGSKFDVEAVATFTNQGTGDTFVTEAFYDGGADGAAVYRFRFTPTSVGAWTFTTSSSIEELSGLTGTVTAVPASDPSTYGFLTYQGGQFAAPRAGSGLLTGIDYQVFMHGGSALEDLGSLPTDEAELRDSLSALLDEAADYGFPTVFVGVWHQWFELGTSRSDRHDSVEPDPATFRVLEILCSMAHDRGMFVHIWQWGDEQRLWSPRGITADAAVVGDAGGVNGAADRRLQRYIAARLGPLPNWVMGYGFDLYEWADEDQVVSWSEYLSARMARPHLLTAIEQRRSATRLFDLGDPDTDSLSLVSDAAAAEAALAGGGEPSRALYRAAVAALAAAGGKPVIFENRFLYQRDDLWTMESVRRSLWALSMAGGVAGIWGIDWDLQEPFDDPDQLRTYSRFWNDRLTSGLVSAVSEDGTLQLLAPDGTKGVIYAEDTDSVNLPPLAPGTTVFAVDTLKVFEPLAIALPEAAAGGSTPPFTWRAPRASDWAVAIGEP